MTSPTPPPPTAASAWPRSAQAACAALLVVVAFLAGWHFRGHPTRPTERVVLVTPVDLNQASRADLLQLPGVGDSAADAILAARDRRGGFQSVDELDEVPGIGPVRLDAMKRWVHIDGAATPGPTAQRGKKTAPGSPIDINRADMAELQTLPGIGPVLAGRIVAEREKAPFRSVDELRRVPGIGVKTLEKLRPMVTAGPRPDGGTVAAQ